MTVLVIGAGGHGRVVADVAQAAGVKVAGFADANASRVVSGGDSRFSRVLMLDVDVLARVRSGAGLPPGIDGVALGIGDNRRRLQLLHALGPEMCPRLVHYAAVVSPSASIGAGTVVMPGAVVNAGARIGAGVIVNTGAIVEHDCVVEDGAHLSPRATLAGGVRVGRRSWIGAGATVIQSRTVGADAIVGAGAVVIRDVPANTKVAGVPAKRIGAHNGSPEHGVEGAALTT